MSVVQPNFNFSKKTEGDYVEIDVVPPPATGVRVFYALGFMAVGLFVGLFGGLLVFGVFLSSLLPTVLIGPLVLASAIGLPAYLYVHVTRGFKERLRPSNIKVNREGIILNGRTYLRPHIKEVFLDGPPGETVVVVSDGQSAGSRLGHTMNRSFNERAFSVKMRYAAEHVTLVDALPRPTAEAVFGEVNSAFAKFA